MYPLVILSLKLSCVGGKTILMKRIECCLKTIQLEWQQTNGHSQHVPSCLMLCIFKISATHGRIVLGTEIEFFWMEWIRNGIMGCTRSRCRTELYHQIEQQCLSQRGGGRENIPLFSWDICWKSGSILCITLYTTFWWKSPLNLEMDAIYKRSSSWK